jgi:2-oxoglutarate ferredoxin oxidoreductase subunit gamma
MRKEIRFSGSGGQGIILISKILAEAAAVYEDLNATQTQSYGPEARGGSSRADVILADEEIDYPRAEHLDLLLALTQEAADLFLKDLKPGGILICDSKFVTRMPTGDFKGYLLPITEAAETQLKKVIVANIVALGAMIGVGGWLKPENVEAAILSRVPRGTEELNLNAFRLGMRLAQDAAR